MFATIGCNNLHGSRIFANCVQKIARESKSREYLQNSTLCKNWQANICECSEAPNCESSQKFCAKIGNPIIRKILQYFLNPPLGDDGVGHVGVYVE
jgi:hypothetical protein